MIAASGLSKTYKGKAAVSDVSFEIATGKVTGFLGPNGAGKSTTMRLMLGLDHGAGTTTFDGKQLSSYERPASVVGALLEAKAYHPTRTARDHLRVLAAAGNVPSADVDWALELVGLKDVGKKGPGKFSLGMSQRLGIAAAILGRPKYLVLDEPANGLDPEGIAWLREFIRGYASDDKAVFISSHLLGEIAQMADNIVIIGKGNLIRTGSVAKLLAQNGHAAVLVRTTSLQKLERTLRSKLMDFKRAEGGLLVSDATTDDIGTLAYENNVPILELTRHQASLESAFLDMTAESQEYVAGSKGHSTEEKS